MLAAANSLEARERLQAIVDGQISAGLAKRGHARRHLEQLRAEARFSASEAKPVTQQLAGLGFKVTKVKTKRPPADG